MPTLKSTVRVHVLYTRTCNSARVLLFRGHCAQCLSLMIPFQFCIVNETKSANHMCKKYSCFFTPNIFTDREWNDLCWPGNQGCLSGQQNINWRVEKCTALNALSLWRCKRPPLVIRYPRMPVRSAKFKLTRKKMYGL